MTRRIYLLDGKRIDSTDCYGFVHKARREYTCVACNKPIKKGEKLVRFNYPFMADEILHLECAVGNWSTDEDKGYVILGVKVIMKKHYGLPRPHVICKKFYPNDNVLKEGEK